MVDVLHCIGLSLLGIISIYLLTYQKKKHVFAISLASIAIVLFLFEPMYKQWGFSFLPNAFANYLTKANGSVFTIIPWFGYAAIGASLSLVFTRFKEIRFFYPIAITTAASLGFCLIYFSSDVFLALSKFTGIQLFADIFFNNYLFIRLGDVFIVFAIFMLLRGLMKNSTVLKIGQSTLSIYVVHFIILYGSFTGLGLYRFLHHSLNPYFAIPGALLFMFVSTYFALRYEQHKEEIKLHITTAVKFVFSSVETLAISAYEMAKPRFIRFLRRFGLVKS